MKATIVLFVLCFTHSLYAIAQFYEVNDTDGFVNVRNNPDTTSAVVCRLNNNTIVQESYTENTLASKNWVHVDFYLPISIIKGEKLPYADYTPPIMSEFRIVSGFIYKSRLVEIEKLGKLKHVDKNNQIKFYNDSISLTITVTSFNVKDHIVSFMKESTNIYEKIDHLPMIGTDGDKPNEEIKRIEMTINKKPVFIGKTFYKNLFNPNLHNNYSEMYTDGKENFYLVMYNSDAAGSYSCIFIFRNGKFIERLVFEGEC
jgi:hypothetical protein